MLSGCMSYETSEQSSQQQIANLAEKLFDQPDGVNLVIFILTFTPAW